MHRSQGSNYGLDPSAGSLVLSCSVDLWSKRGNSSIYLKNNYLQTEMSSSRSLAAEVCNIHRMKESRLQTQMAALTVLNACFYLCLFLTI